MKKILCVALAAFMLFSLTACGGKEVGGSVKNDGGSSVKSEDAFKFGVTNATKYENEFLGLGFKIPDGWSFLNEEQKDYLSQIMNAQDRELNDDQKNLRDKILNDKDFQNKIIDSWKNNFGKVPGPEDKEAIIQDADKTSIADAAKKYKLHGHQIQEWIKDKTRSLEQ